MKSKFLFISMMLILVISIGAASAADISDASDSNSDISIASPVDSVDGDGFDYAGDSIDTNNSDSSDVLGVGEEDDVIGTGVFDSIVFPDAVDGVITWDTMNYDRYIRLGYSDNTIKLDILDANGEHIEITNYRDWEFEYDGFPADKNWEDYRDVMEYVTESYNDVGEIPISEIMYLVGLYDDDGDLLYDEYLKTGNHTLTVYNKDKSFSQSVKIVMLEPKYVKATVTTNDIITVNVTSNDGPGNFTVYVADNIVANGTVDANGTGSASFDVIYGKNTLKVILDGATKSGLKYETTINIIKVIPGSFLDLNNRIANATDVLDLPYDFKLNPGESELFQNGISIKKNLTINGNGHTINATCSDGTGARVFDVNNRATLTLNNATLVGGGYGKPNGGAIVGATYTNIIVNNVIFSENNGNYGGAIFINQYANLTATNVKFIKNSATSGGGIYAQQYNTIKLNNVLFENESTTSTGGDIYLNGYSDVDIKNSTFKNFYLKKNTVSAGSIHVKSYSNVNISDCSFENYTLEMQSGSRRYLEFYNYGGVIRCNDYVVLNVTGTTFKNNKNINPGPYAYAYSIGIIYSVGTNSYNYISDCEFINNTAQQSVIYTRNADIIGCVFVNNSATNDYPEIYYEGSGKGTISHNAFLDDNTIIRIRNNANNVVETTNWWANNSPGDLVRIENSYVAPNNYIVMSVYNEGNTAYAALTRNSLGDFIENPELLPVRTAIFESSETTSADTVDGVAGATVSDSQVNVTIDGQTMTLFMAPGNVTSIQIVAVENTTVGADGKVYIVLAGDNGPVDGILTVMSNNHSYEVEVSNGFAIAQLGSDFDAGVYDIYYIYEGSANYAAINTKTKVEEQFEVYKSDVIITIDREKNIITFNVVGDNSVIPTGSINVTVGDINKVFTLSNGAASYNYGNDLGPGVYDVNVTYSGDKNNNEGSLVTTFEIIKNTVEITFTNVTNTLTFNVTGTDGLIATGKIIVILGNSTQTLTLNNGIASYDFGKVLPAGEYNLTVNYTGDDYYVPGLMEDTFEIVKMTPTIELTISNINITQGNNALFVIKVIGDEHIATGYVTLVVGDKSYRASLRDGVRQTNFGSQLKAGMYNITVTYEGDGYYYATNMTYNETLNVLPKITISAPSEVYSELAPLIINIDPVDVNGTLIVKMDGVELFFDDISSGYLYLTLSNLEEGEHTFEAYYGGNDKIMPNSATVTTTVSYPELPQWAQQGYDYTNGGQSPYARLNEIMELWNFTADPGSSNNVPTLLIDAEGNIYVAFNRKVTSIYANGTERWISTGGRWGGEVIDAHGHMIAPQSGNAFSYLDISDGSCPAPWGTFYQGSSSYAPVIGPDGVIYVSYEYSYPYSGSYYDPTQVWGDRRWIGLVNPDLSYRGQGNSLVRIEGEGLPYGTQPHLAPVTIDNAGNLWHTSTSGLRGVEIGTNTIVFQDANIGTKGRAVVDANNIVYVFGGEDQIFAVTAAGILWNTTVTDGSGSTMVVGKDSEYILSINSEGVLYKYDVTNGKETKVYDFETTVSTALMTDANGVIYVGDDDGTFWALTDDGTVLWTFDADSAITARPVMDKNGVIYIYTADNVLYALGFNKENSTISLEVNDTTTVEGLTAIATVNDDATGEVTFILNNETIYSVEIIDGTATLVLDTIAAGDYNITAIYTGNYAYNGNETSAKFTVTKVNSTIEIDTLETIYVDTNGTIIITIENATGNVTVKINGLDDITTELNDSVAVLVLPVLAEGTYNITAVYEGDETYLGSTVTDEFDVVKYIPELDIDIDDVSVIENATITVTVPNATGTVTVKVNSKEETADLVDGVAVIDLGLFDAGDYNVTVTYNGDDIFYDVSGNDSFTVSKIDTELDADVESGEAFENVIVTVEVDDYATGNITVIIDGKEYSDVILDNVAEIIIPGLGAGDYAAEIVYKGNDKVNENSTTVEFTIDKIDEFDMEASENVSAVSAGTITVYLPVPATGNVTIIIDDEEYSANVTNGVAVVEVPAMAPGEYEYTIYYSGDDNYEDATDEGIFVVIKEDTVLNITVGEDGISVELPEDATGYVLVDVNGTGYFAPVKDGVADVKIIGLDAGNYTTTIIYTGDENYNPANATGTYEIPEIIPEDPELEATVENTTITVKVNENATGNVLVDIDGIGYYSAVEDGQAVIEAYGLEDGQSYEAVVTYLGDDVFAPANTTVTVTVPKVEPVDPQADIEVGNETISIDLPEDATGYLLVDVDGVGYYAPVEDGQATVELPELAPGNHTVTVTYTGDAKYASVNTTENITIELKETIISEDLTKIEKAPDRFEATFLDADGNALAETEVTFEINGQQYKRTTDANGKASMGINIPAGNYTIKSTNPVTGEVKENNITILSRFIAEGLVKYYRNDTQYVMKVFGDDGKYAQAGEVVTFNINGVFYNRTVNETGDVKLNINLPPGEYIITAEYKGCKMANTVVVLPVLTGENVVKKFGEAKPYEVKLVDGQGKPYAGQTISMNINGVLYNKVTDSDGIAKLNINLPVGEYIITATHEYASVSNTVTITA